MPTLEYQPYPLLYTNDVIRLGQGNSAPVLKDDHNDS